MEKIEYDGTVPEKSRIAADQAVQGNVLIEDQIHADGCFLVFESKAEIEIRHLQEELAALRAELLAANVWLFRMVSAHWEADVARGYLSPADIPDAALKQKYVRWRDVVLPRLLELGE